MESAPTVDGKRYTGRVDVGIDPYAGQRTIENSGEMPSCGHALFEKQKMNKKCSILNKNLLMVYGKACYTEIEYRTKSVFLALDFKLKLVF